MQTQANYVVHVSPYTEVWCEVLYMLHNCYNLLRTLKESFPYKLKI